MNIIGKRFVIDFVNCFPSLSLVGDGFGNWNSYPLLFCWMQTKILPTKYRWDDLGDESEMGWESINNHFQSHQSNIRRSSTRFNWFALKAIDICCISICQMRCGAFRCNSLDSTGIPLIRCEKWVLLVFYVYILTLFIEINWNKWVCIQHSSCSSLKYAINLVRK